MTLTPSSSVLSREAGTSQEAHRAPRRRLSASHLLIAAVVVLAFVLNLLALQEREATALVAVAKHPLTAGSTLSAESVRLVPVSADFEGLGSLVEEGELPGYEGWVLERSVPAGGLLDRSILVEPGAPDGLRSMSIPIETSHAAGGSIAAGDRVDVISVRDGVAAYVATGVEVIGVADVDAGSLGRLGAYHVVLAVDADQALRLAEALESDSLEIIRSTGAPQIGAESDGA